MTQQSHDNISNTLLVFVFIILGMCVGQALSSQTCPQPFTLRQETCPAGDSVCSTKASTLTYRELDRSLLNIIGLCNSVGQYTFPAPGVGVLRSDALGIISLVTTSGIGSCSAGQFVSALNNNAAPTCGTPAGGGGGGTPIALDLADNDANESAAITEIATTGDTNNIFTEPSADKLLIAAGTPWLTATALAANPTNCFAGQYPLGIAANGAVESCTVDDDTPDVDSEVPNNISLVSGFIGNNTLQGAVKTSGLTDEPAQANLGDSPVWLGIADGTAAVPVTSVEPSVTFQKWTAAVGTSIPYQFYTNQMNPSSGNLYSLDSVVRQNSPIGGDSVATTGRTVMEPFGLVSGLGATPSASGGTLATATYGYYVAGIVATEERVGSSHVTTPVTGPTGSVSLTWTALSGATSYRIYRYLPNAPDVVPVYFTSATNSYTDTGSAGTTGVGRSATGWGGWFQCWSYTESGRCAGAEINALNMTTRASSERTDRVGVSLGLQVVSVGTADTTAGIDITGESASKFASAITFGPHAFRLRGLDFRISDATAPAIRLASTQDIVARNAGNTADISIAELDASNVVRLGAGAVAVDPTNVRLGVVTSTPDERLEIEESANISTIGLVQNTSTGSSAIAIWRSESDGAIVSMNAHGSGRVATRFGVTLANYGELLQTTGNGLLVGTSTAVPLIFGTSALQRMTINADGSIDIPSMSVPSNPAAGTRRLFVDSGTGEMSVRTAAGSTVSLESGVGGGGGAPVDPTYLTLTTNGTLTNERVLTAGLGLTSTDGGAGSALTLGFLTTDTLAGNPSYSAEDVVFTKDGTGGGLLFEGSTADAFEGLLVWNPTSSDKTLIIPDVTGSVLTTADSGTVTSTILLDNSVAEADLKIVDSAADEECLTYEATIGDFEWQSCGTGGGATALPRVSARLTADQTITTSTDTPIAFNTEVVDQGGFHDNVTNNSRFTVPSGEDGTYIASCGAFIQQGTNERILRIRKNGTTIVAEDKDGGISNTGINMGMTASVVLELVATDYTECLVFHAHGSSILVRTDERTHGSLTKMR